MVHLYREGAVDQYLETSNCDGREELFRLVHHQVEQADWQKPERMPDMPYMDDDVSMSFA